MSKELKGIESAMHKYVLKHKGRVLVCASFMGLSKKDNVVDDKVYFIGDNKELKWLVKDMLVLLKNRKE